MLEELKSWVRLVEHIEQVREHLAALHDDGEVRMDEDALNQVLTRLDEALGTYNLFISNLMIEFWFDREAVKRTPDGRFAELAPRNAIVQVPNDEKDTN